MYLFFKTTFLKTYLFFFLLCQFIFPCFLEISHPCIGIGGQYFSKKTRQHIFENKTGQPWLRTTLKFLRVQVEMKNPEHHAVAAAMIIPQIFMSAKSTPFPVVVHSALKP